MALAPDQLLPIEEIDQWLTPDVRTTVVSLHGLCPAEQQMLVSLTPFGSRVSLSTLGITTGYQQDECRLTDYGRRVVEHLQADPQ